MMKSFLFSPHSIEKNPELFTEAYHNLNQLRLCEKLDNIIRENKIIKSKRQPKNLKQILTRAKFETQNITSVEGVTKCNKKRCKVCDILIEGKSFKFKHIPIEFEVKRNLTCTSKNVIYVMRCDKCKDEYIGSTQQLNHRVHVALHRILFVSKHIYEYSKGQFHIMPLYQTDNYSNIQIKEQHLIDKYKPLLNRT